MADTNYTIDDLWKDYNEEVIEATKGLVKEKAEEKALDLAVDFFAKHCSEDITGMDSDTYKLVFQYIKDGTITNNVFSGFSP